MSNHPTARLVQRPNPIDPAKYPALEELRRFAERGGKGMLDRVYADAQNMHTKLRMYEDLYGPLEEEGADLL